MTLTEEPSGLWRLDTGGTLIGYDGEHNVCSIQIALVGITGAWTWYLDMAYIDGTVATAPLEQVKDTISVLLSRSYMREGLVVVQVRGVAADAAVKKSSTARVRFGASVNAAEQMDAPSPSQWDIYSGQVAGYRDAAAASAAAAALAATQMPYINSGGTWSVWSTSAGGFVDSGVSAAGITPDIQIGTVTTLPAGSEATASMSGTAAEPLLNLGIPKGDKGDPGSGGGISALYMRVDNGVIQYSADGVSWADLISTAELTGPAGSPGEQGPPGSDGVSPTVTVTQTATGAVIEATDASGTTSATVSNGRDGQPGQPGADGSPGAPGHTPEITASKSGKVTTIMADGTAIAEISDGADGAPGAAGADGVTPDIQIGTVTTLPAGSEATASMSGTAAEPLLNLGIPKGDKGDSGGASAAELSLGITSATIGQTIKVKAVDTDGKPTAWEAVDMDAEKFPKFTKLITHTITKDELESSPTAFVWGTDQIPNLNDFNVFVLSIARPDGVQITFNKWVRLKINNMLMGNICGTPQAAEPQYVITANRLFGVWISGSYYNAKNISVPVLVPPQSSSTYQSNLPASEPVTSIGFTSYAADYGLTAGIVVELWGAK